MAELQQSRWIYIKPMQNQNKIILDLCGGTGSWSAPYKENGFNVINITLPEYDVRVFTPPNNVYGIFAAPPCTMFSLARTTAKTPRDLEKGLFLVKHCIRIIWDTRPKFWVMENPKGLLRKFMGKPAFSFDASEFGEDYNKATDLWGYFNEPKKKQEYIRFPSTDKNTRKLPSLPENYVLPKGESRISARRAITPRGFAEAFFKANG